MKNKFWFVLSYRIVAFVIITLGLLANTLVFTGKPNFYALLAYTTQSNLLVWLFFIVLITKTIIQKIQNKNEYGFYPIVSFSITIAITITMLIFWLVLAPTSWGNTDLWNFDNFGVHLFCPLFMIGDKILFYKSGTLERQNVFCILIFPYIYVIQSFALGLSRAVWFEQLGIKSYYIYPFLDFDKFGGLVFVFILALTAVFLGIGFAWWFIEKKIKEKQKNG